MRKAVQGCGEGYGAGRGAGEGIGLGVGAAVPGLLGQGVAGLGTQRLRPKEPMACLMEFLKLKDGCIPTSFSK